MRGSLHVENLLPAYALGCLEEQELDRVRRHLEDCDACRASLDRYEELTASLGLAAPRAQPPAGLKRRILAGVSGRPAPARLRLAGGAARASLRLALPIAAAALLFLSLGLNLALWRRLAHLEATTPVLPDQVALLGATPSAAGARGMLLFHPEDTEATLVVEDLPPLQEGRQYQLWLIREGKRTNGGVFSVTSGGYGCLLIASPSPVGSYDALGITEEPAGGSSGPTGRRVLGGNL